MSISDSIGNDSNYQDLFNEANLALYGRLSEIHYDKYVFFAICSALFGLPSNILLLVILVRIGLFSRRQSGLTYLTSKPTGSFERFLFEVVFVDTLLIIYHFVDNFLSYIEGDRSAGQHFLIHFSDFCCKFFTYIAKMSVPMTTWLLFFLVLNRLILTMDYNHNNRSLWNRGLYYVNAKYSTVFLIFIFSVYNIYPIEVLKYQKKEDVQDYREVERGEVILGVCSTIVEGKSRRLLNAISNYGYNLLGGTIPCLIILMISITIIYRTCRSNTYNTNKDSHSFHYIAATIGIVHCLFNLPTRCSDFLLLSLSPYASFFPYLIKFNHEIHSFMSLSYAYKCFVCIIISRRFRRHAKSVLCFLIENQYEDRHTIDLASTNHELNHTRKHKDRHSKHRYHHNHNHHHYSHNHNRKDFYLMRLANGDKPTSRKFSFSHINKDDFRQFTSSEATYWIRPYFTQNERRQQFRPCGDAASCHELAMSVDSDADLPSERVSQQQNDLSPSTNPTESSSFLTTSVVLTNGEFMHVPLPQKRSRPETSMFSPNRIDLSVGEHSLKTTIFTEETEKQRPTNYNYFSSSHIY